MLYNFDMAGYLTVKQVAARLNVSPEAVRKLIKRERLKAEKFGDEMGGMWLIKEEDFDAFERRPPGRPTES